MGNKVVCAICLNQAGGFCEVKSSKIKLKKKRLCDKFRQDISKIKIKQPIPTKRRPEYFWDRDKKRRFMKEQLKKLQDEQAQRSSAGQIIDDKASTVMLGTGSKKHPLTGDLSRFTTTIKKSEDKE